MKLTTGTSRWLLRLVAAGAAAALTSVAVLRSADLVTTNYPRVQTEALKVLLNSLKPGPAGPPSSLSVVFFGDSLSIGTDWHRAQNDSLPGRLHFYLTAMVRDLVTPPQRAVRFTTFAYTGLSIWSLYYITDEIIALHPDLAVIEFNLYNFSPHWHTIEHKPLSGMLPLTRFPEAQTLPLAAAGFATDQWLFNRSMLKLGLLGTWNAVEGEQARLDQAYWKLTDTAARAIPTVRQFTVHDRNRLLDLRAREYADPPGSKNMRSTALFTRLLLGKALAGVRRDDAALRMLDAILAELASAGIRTAVYIPPYNLEHIDALGLLRGSHLDNTIDRVREAVEARGGTLIDIHAKIVDRYFRDSMDHLRDMEPDHGLDAAARELAIVLKPEARSIVSSRH